MKEFIFVFIGGGVGSCLRFLLSCIWKSASLLPCLSGILFPWPTLLANCMGCFLIGLFYSHAPYWHLKPETSLLLTTGFCGGFTTFSAFSWEAISLLGSGHITQFAIYLFLSISIGLLAVLLGTKL